MEQTRWTTGRPQLREMREKAGLRETFFAASSRSTEKRPKSVHTEFMETDWEMEESEADSEIYSEIEDEVACGLEDGESSPRISVGSSGQPSFTTLSSYDEVHTPRSVMFRGDAEFDQKPVEGPRGPHLFHNSITSAQSIEFAHALSLSPLTPKDPRQLDSQLHSVYRTTLPTRRRASGPFRFTDEELETSTLPEWTPEMVAQWMLNAGIELPATERFVENDINGAILITLKFQDLKELGISSFGVRTRIWEEIHAMRNIQQPEPQPETPIEDEPDRRARRELHRQESNAEKPKRKASKPRVKINDVVSPLESVSIVGIEQMMPKPHSCSKGENCAKWKRNQRMIEAFKKDHPFVDVNSGSIMVAGNPGNPDTAVALNPAINDDSYRPFSDAIPSFVASSDVMGPGGLPPVQYLQEAMLQSVQQRDPQDNVIQFLNFQTKHVGSISEVPPTPPFEILPRDERPRAGSTGLRGLPKLSIPPHPTAPVSQQPPASAHPASAAPMSAYPMTGRRSSSPQIQIPSHREVSPANSEEATPTAVYRFGTPFSDMDVPVTVTALPPVSRDFSQSVPPDMSYRHNPATPRSMSRATNRRPSFPVLPALDENKAVTPFSMKPARTFPMTRTGGVTQPGGQKPLHAPPRAHYPWTSEQHPTMERAIPPLSTVNIGGRHSPLSSTPKVDMTGGEAISYQGLMKKRKTKMLRHEWHEHFFTLRGTRLAMHKDAQTAQNKTLEYIDIDDYAIACSSLASSKLNAAFKAMHLRRSSDDKASKGDVAAFSFQLIPQDVAKNGARLKKRESTLSNILGGGNSSTSSIPGLEGAVNGTGKTHHFAVKNRDERIDWMRELMLAKALKQKGDGFEVSVNGNMI